jgi:ribulose-phosphate 3-epimerase
VDVVRDLTDEVDMVLCMTVNPGWGGQAFPERSLDRLRRIRALLGPDKALEVDGGIDAETAPRCAAAGATVFVAGTAVFGAPDPQGAVRAITAAIRR